MWSVNKWSVIKWSFIMWSDNLVVCRQVASHKVICHQVVFHEVVCHQVVFISVVFQHWCLSSGLSFTWVVFCEGCLSSGLSFTWVVFHHWCLSSGLFLPGWSFVRCLSSRVSLLCVVFLQSDRLFGWSFVKGDSILSGLLYFFIRMVFRQGCLSSGGLL